MFGRRRREVPAPDDAPHVQAPAPPPITDHLFDPWTSDGGWTICIHLDGAMPCGRSEREHAPAVDTEAGA